MDSKLEDDIMKRIPGEISESYVVAWDLGNLFMLYTDTHANLDSYWYRSGSKTILGGMTIEGRRNRLNEMRWVRVGRCIRANTGTDKNSRRGRKQKLAMATLMWICHSEKGHDMKMNCAMRFL